MAKRFTDTGKWKRPWFRALSAQAKVLWQYMVDECDHAGIWIADFGLATFQVGFKVDESVLAELLGDKLVKLGDDRYFIPSFFEFQYADAKDSFKAKQSALKELRSWNLLDDSDSLIDLSNSYLSVTGLSLDCPIKSKSKIKGKSKINTGSAEGAEPATDADREAVYAEYPQKVGKSAGLAKLKKLCPTRDELAEFKTAMLNYVADCKKTNRYFKQFDTFVNSTWRDWLDPSHGGLVEGQSTSERSMAEILADQEGA